MTYSLILFQYRLMSLAIGVLTTRIATCIQEKLCLVKIFTVASHKVKAYQGHFGYLMPRNQFLLIRSVANSLTDTVGILNGNIQEITFAGSLIMSNSTFHHMSQVIELMAEFLYLCPTFRASPVMGMFRIHGTGSI